MTEQAENHAVADLDPVVLQRDNNGKRPGGSTGKGFTKNDPRINRKGRPKSFDALRRLAQQIACEVVKDPDLDAPVSRVELMLRKMAGSGDARKAVPFLEIAYGKVPAPVEVTGKGGGPIATQQVFDHSSAIAALAARSAEDRGESGDDSDRSDGEALG